MVQDNQTPILDLRNPGEDVDLPRIRLDSGEYPILRGEHIGPANISRFFRLYDDHRALLAEESDWSKLTDDLAERLEANMLKQVALICPTAPQEELAAVPFLHKLRLVRFFLRASGIDTLAEAIAETKERDDRLTGTS